MLIGEVLPELVSAQGRLAVAELSPVKESDTPSLITCWLFDVEFGCVGLHALNTSSTSRTPIGRNTLILTPFFLNTVFLSPSTLWQELFTTCVIIKNRGRRGP